MKENIVKKHAELGHILVRYNAQSNHFGKMFKVSRGVNVVDVRERAGGGFATGNLTPVLGKSWCHPWLRGRRLLRSHSKITSSSKRMLF